MSKTTRRHPRRPDSDKRRETHRPNIDLFTPETDAARIKAQRRLITEIETIYKATGYRRQSDRRLWEYSPADLERHLNHLTENRYPWITARKYRSADASPPAQEETQ